MIIQVNLLLLEEFLWSTFLKSLLLKIGECHHAECFGKLAVDEEIWGGLLVQWFCVDKCLLPGVSTGRQTIYKAEA